MLQKLYKIVQLVMLLLDFTTLMFQLSAHRMPENLLKKSKSQSFPTLTLWPRGPLSPDTCRPHASKLASRTSLQRPATTAQTPPLLGVPAWIWLTNAKGR